MEDDGEDGAGYRNGRGERFVCFCLKICENKKKQVEDLQVGEVFETSDVQFFLWRKEEG